ncbi:HNH endonuclease family protein, partial [Streptococcus sanguinis]
IEQRDREWVQQFGQLLLTMKHIFDTFIVKNVQLENETEWQIKRAQYETYQRNENRGWKYVLINFQKNTFDNLNKNIILLQSMFAVTFTANRDSRWLYEILQFLYKHIEELNDQEFVARFKEFLEKMAVRYAEERLFTEDRSIKKYGDIPVYAFNFVDYILWKHRSGLKEKYSSVEFEAFKFTYRRSIEHWYPQNPNSDERIEKMDDKFLHSFGNLCIITDSQNSKFGNLDPSAKYKQWEGIFSRQSLKLQIMAAITEKTKWKSDQVLGLEKEILPMVNEFIRSKK